MKRVWRILGDIAVTVGGIVGVGFLSGKEAQFFWQGKGGVALFVALFAVVTLAFREHCRVHGAATVRGMGDTLFAKGEAWVAAIALCSFVCAVTVLAGVEESLGLLVAPLPLPVYALAAAVTGALLYKAKMGVLKAANALSLLLALGLLGALLATRGHASPNGGVTLQPVVYALFSATMTLGVSARLGASCTRRENAVVSVASALVTGAIMLAVLRVCRFGAPLPALDGLSLPLRALAAVALLLCSATGLAANVVPVVELLRELIPDDTLCVTLTFGLGLALSLFGFDFALRFGYLAVALIGLLTAVRAGMCLIGRKL